MIETFADKDKVLVSYLFNELSQSEAAELEDEMLLDNELFERVQVVEMNLIDGYVRNEMTPEESLRFKEKFLAVPENREKVRRAQMFHECLILSHEKEQVVPPPTRGLGRESWLATLSQRPSPALAFAAAVLLLVAVVVAVVVIQRRAGTTNSIAKNSAPPVSDNVNQEANNAPGGSVAGVPTPLKSPVVPSSNNRPNGRGLQIAENVPQKHTQRVIIYSQDQGGGERGGKVIHISLGEQVTNLDLVYQLLEDIPERESFGVAIKNQFGKVIWPENDKGKEEVKPVRTGPGRFIVVNVRTSVFKDGGPYLFEFDDPNIPAKQFTIKK